MKSFVFALSAFALQVTAHCALKFQLYLLITDPLSSDTFPSLVVGGVTTPQWVYVRETNNYDTQAPV